MSYQPSPPPPERGHTTALAAGAVLGAVLLVVCALLGLALMSSTNGAVFFVGPVLGLALPIVLMTRPATRWWGVGLLIGFFLALIVLGGACVALLSSVSG